MAIAKPILLELPIPITTPRLLIRPLMPGDGAIINKAVVENLALFKEWLPWAQKVPTLEESEETARKFYAKFIQREELHFVVFADNKFIGMSGFNGFNWEVQSGAIGYWCAERGHGYITEAVNAITRYGFEQIGLRRATILCDDENVKSAAVAERLKFALEVRAKGICFKPGCQDLRYSRRYVRFDTKDLPPLEVKW